MSQYPTQPAVVQVAPSNGLGTAGFICSLIGIFTGGLLCPIGLIISLIALGRQPRGLAIAGVIIGLIGSCGGLIAIIFFGAALLAMVGLAAAVVLSDVERFELTTDMSAITIAVVAYEDKHGVLPADLDVLGLDSGLLTDPWENAYGYHFIDEEPGYEIISLGPDGRSGTLDDVAFSTLGELWEEPFQTESIPEAPEAPALMPDPAAEPAEPVSTSGG